MTKDIPNTPEDVPFGNWSPFATSSTPFRSFITETRQKNCIKKRKQEYKRWNGRKKNISTKAQTFWR